MSITKTISALLRAGVAAAALSAASADAGFLAFFGIFDKKKTTEAVTDAAVDSGKTAAAGAASTVDVESALQTARSVKNALASASEKGKQLKSLLGDNPQLQGYLDKALDAMYKGDDLLALDTLEEFSRNAKLTGEQSKLAGDLKKDFEILALGRNFPEGGPVSVAIDALQAGDTSKAMSSLTNILKDGELTGEQRSIVRKVIDAHASDLKRLLPF